MAGRLVAIAEIKRKLASQSPITVGGDRVSSSATISRQPQPQGVGKGKPLRYSLWRKFLLPTLLLGSGPEMPAKMMLLFLPLRLSSMLWIKGFWLPSLWTNNSWMKRLGQLLPRCRWRIPFLGFKGCFCVPRRMSGIQRWIL
ncbi:hypothetical protein AHAS_Ahas13G0220100 [Arachis hypogaea]